jgi:hypothetical protein
MTKTWGWILEEEQAKRESKMTTKKQDKLGMSHIDDEVSHYRDQGQHGKTKLRKIYRGE